MGTLITGALVASLVFLAGYKVYKDHKNGKKCAGCSAGCSRCPSRKP